MRLEQMVIFHRSHGDFIDTGWHLMVMPVRAPNPWNREVAPSSPVASPSGYAREVGPTAKWSCRDRRR